MAAHNSAKIVVGRLLEIAIPEGYKTVADVDAMIGQLQTVAARLPASLRVVIVADWRQCLVFSSQVAERIPALFGAIPRIERSAILHLDDHATSVMQILRLIQEARFPDRQVFTSIPRLTGYLGGVLTDRERARLETFLAPT